MASRALHRFATAPTKNDELKAFHTVLLLVLLGLVCGCSQLTRSEWNLPGLGHSDDLARAEPKIEKWALILQDIEISELLDKELDLVVLEPFFNGDSEPGISSGDLAKLHRQGIRVLAYLSVGEAEDYRAYWQAHWEHTPPDFLEDENPEWPGNYKVHFWDPKWQAIMEASLLERLEAGYDGVYLDLVDAYEYYRDKGRDQGRQEMIDFVVRLSEISKKKKPTFLIFAQNAEELTASPSYLKAIDGIGREELYFGYEGRDNRSTPREVTEFMNGYLEKLKTAGKTVLTVEYTNRPEQIQSAKDSTKRSGFVPFFAPRLLDSLPDQGA